jgi:syntaxin 1B/2/3
VLIQAQGEMLDNIEANLEDANDYVEKAETQLRNAQKIHKEGRNKMCCMLICIFISMIVLYLWLFSG